MASLSEMIQYAQAKQEPDTLAQLAAVALQGAGVGFESYQQAKEKKAKREQQEFDKALKIIDAQEKLRSIENLKLKNTYDSWRLKAAGVLPLDENEEMIARQVAGTTLGAGKKPKTDNTVAGKAFEMFKDPGKFDVELAYGTDGPTWKYTTRKPDEKRTRSISDEDKLNEEILKLANEIGRAIIIEEMSATPNPQAPDHMMFVQGISNPNMVSVPPELRDALIPAARDYKMGLFESAKKKREAVMAGMLPIPLTGKKSAFDKIKGMAGAATKAGFGALGYGR